MAMWNRCAICGRAIPVGELCYGIKNWCGDPVGGDTICRDCLVPENAPTLTPPNEWVSVEERLPGVSGNYICAVKDKNGSVWTIPAEWSLEVKMWIGAFGEIKNIVTHWTPLPAPPYRRQPEGEED